MIPEHIIILALIAMLAFYSHLTARERRELYNRIMAGSLKEYQQQTDPSPPPKARNVIKKGLENYVEGQK